jgi:hypothetical protein
MAASREISVCSCEPSRRIETVRPAASFLPATKRIGTLASELAHLIGDFLVAEVALDSKPGFSGRRHHFIA